MLKLSWISYLLLFFLNFLVGCQRGPLDQVCPFFDVGVLVVSEIRGQQSADQDPYGQWIELYNTSNETLHLLGLKIRLRKLDGSGTADIYIRDDTQFVEPASYFVMGNAQLDQMPDFLHYSYVTDFSKNLYPDGIIEILACETLVDRVIYYNLPREGTLAFDGALELTALKNDDQSSWCQDVYTYDENGRYPGTPGERNQTCQPTE